MKVCADWSVLCFFVLIKFHPNAKDCQKPTGSGYSGLLSLFLHSAGAASWPGRRRRRDYEQKLNRERQRQGRRYESTAVYEPHPPIWSTKAEDPSSALRPTNAASQHSRATPDGFSVVQHIPKNNLVQLGNVASDLFRAEGVDNGAVER